MGLTEITVCNYSIYAVNSPKETPQPAATGQGASATASETLRISSDMKFNLDQENYPPPSIGDLRAVEAAVRLAHAQLRLITATNFAAFLELSRVEQRHAILGALNSTESAVEILDNIPALINPDQG